MLPSAIKVVDNKFLLIEWTNNSKSNIKLVNLRANCPCAVCDAERREHGKNYFPIYSDKQIEIEKIDIIGNYALGITWKDGHNTGIYQFNYLTKIVL